MSDNRVLYYIDLSDKLSPKIQAATGRVGAFDKKVRGVKGSARSMGKGLSSLAGGMTSFLGPLGLAITGVQALTSAVNYATDSIRQARDWESDLNALKFASGNAEEFAKNLEFVQTTADKLGLSVTASMKGFKEFSGAVKGTKLEGQAAREIFEGLSMASSVLGLKADESEGALRALSQMASKGKVSAEELRQQLGERLPGALGIAARSMGMTQQELNKMMESGELMSDEFLPKFAAELKKTFGPGLAESMKSSRAQFNRFNNALFELKLTIGEALLPVVNDLMSAFMRMFRFVKRNSEDVISVFRTIFKWNTMGLRVLLSIYDALFENISATRNWGDVAVGVFNAIVKVASFVEPILDGIVSVFKIGLFPLMKGMLLPLDLLIRGYQVFWSLIKNIFSSAATMFTSLTSILMNPFDFDNVSKNVDKIFNNLKTNVGDLKADFLNTKGLKDIAGAGLDMLAESGSKSRKEKKQGGIKQTIESTESTNLANTLGSTSPTSSDAVTKISSGRPTTVNIDVGKLVENLTIQSATMEESYSQMKSKIEKVLFDVLNQSNNYVLNG